MSILKMFGVLINLFTLTTSTLYHEDYIKCLVDNQFNAFNCIEYEYKNNFGRLLQDYNDVSEELEISEEYEELEINNNLLTSTSTYLSNDYYLNYTSTSISTSLLSDNCVNLGDYNQDNIIDILDVVSVINHILYEYDTQSNILCLYGDVNQDNTIDIMDVVQIINEIINNRRILSLSEEYESEEYESEEYESEEYESEEYESEEYESEEYESEEYEYINISQDVYNCNDIYEYISDYISCDEQKKNLTIMLELYNCIDNYENIVYEYCNKTIIELSNNTQDNNLLHTDNLLHIDNTLLTSNNILLNYVNPNISLNLNTLNDTYIDNIDDNIILVENYQLKVININYDNITSDDNNILLNNNNRNIILLILTLLFITILFSLLYIKKLNFRRKIYNLANIVDDDNDNNTNEMSNMI